MGIYIKGMEMPKKCYGCFQEYHPVNLLSGTCKLTGESTDGFAYKRREDCPLIEVSEPHGRLIDADMAYQETMKYGNHFRKSVLKTIENMQTVIERSDK